MDLFIASSHEDQQEIAGKSFPLILANTAPKSDLAAVITAIKHAKVELLAKLAEHGAILFRGYPLSSDEDFDAFVSAFELPNFTYAESLSNAVRRNRTPRVFTANEAPPEVSIFLHHEMAQTPLFPSKLFFFCEHAAYEGGATPLCRSDELLEQLAKALPDFVADCESKGVRYTNTMPYADDAESGQGRSWRSTLSALTELEAEKKLADLDYDWVWLADRNLQVTSPVLPAVRSAENGTAVFFNQLIAAFRGWKDSRNAGNRAIVFGDGSQISESAMAVAIELADKLSFDLAWQTGDVALVDNYLVMHGRRPFKGTRRVLASLVAA